MACAHTVTRYRSPLRLPSTWMSPPRNFANLGSRQSFSHDIPAHAGEARVHPGVEVRQLGVVEAHQPQDRRVQIRHMAALLDRAEAELVRRADGLPSLDARARQPHREAIPVVIPPRLADA